MCFVLFCFVFLQPSISDLLEGEEQDASQDVDVQEITSGSEQVENYNHKHELLISVIIFITFLKPSSLLSFFRQFRSELWYVIDV